MYSYELKKDSRPKKTAPPTCVQQMIRFPASSSAVIQLATNIDATGNRIYFESNSDGSGFIEKHVIKEINTNETKVSLRILLDRLKNAPLKHGNNSNPPPSQPSYGWYTHINIKPDGSNETHFVSLGAIYCQAAASCIINHLENDTRKRSLVDVPKTEVWKEQYENEQKIFEQLIAKRLASQPKKKKVDISDLVFSAGEQTEESILANISTVPTDVYPWIKEDSTPPAPSP